MKNLIRLSFLLGIFCLLGIGCQETPADQDELRISLNKVKIPEGTDIKKVSENESYLSLPENIYFVSVQEDEQTKSLVVSSMPGAGVRCKCTEGSGCNPTVMSGDYACVMTTGCSSCDLSTSKSSSLDKSFEDNLIRIKGLVDYNQGITFLTESLTGDMMQDAYLSTKGKTYGNAFDELFELEAVRRGILEFYSGIYEENIPGFIMDNDRELPGDYSYVAVNLYGNIAVMPFPDEKIQEQNRMAPLMHFPIGNYL